MIALSHIKLTFIIFLLLDYTVFNTKHCVITLYYIPYTIVTSTKLPVCKSHHIT